MVGVARSSGKAQRAESGAADGTGLCHVSSVGPGGMTLLVQPITCLPPDLAYTITYLQCDRIVHLSLSVTLHHVSRDVTESRVT